MSTEAGSVHVQAVTADLLRRKRGEFTPEEIAERQAVVDLLKSFPARRARREKGDEAAELAVATPHETVWLEMHGHHTVDFDHKDCDHPDDKLHNAHADCHCRDAERAALKTK